ncbi:MAG TPA: serine--tRNA ligase [Terriglobales bacterium]
MLDLAYVRDNLAAVEEMFRRRGMDPAETLGGFRAADERRRQLITQAETVKAQRNRLSEEIAKLKKTGQNDATAAVVEQSKSLREQGEALEKQAGESDQELKDRLALIPNMLHQSVPQGRSSEDNVEVRGWGKVPEFSFPPKPHWELGEQLGVLDMERAVKLSGARFAVYWDLGARMERALANFMLDLHTREHGYTEVLPPYVVNSDSMYGTGQLPKFAQDSFKCEQHDLWLIPTAEVPLTNLYRGETLEASRLPVSVTAYTPCFRSEAGSYGKDVRGIIRQHQFQKVELVKFTRPEESYELHERLTHDAEVVLQKLGLPYRVMLLCSADTGPSSAKTYDLEVWLPGQRLYREISSCSNFEAFQARRANIRWRPEGSKKSEFVHTLNGSGLAIGRTWLAILENYQLSDGSVVVPEVLRPYMNAERIVQRKF